jgi:hypothetical protein
MATLLELLCRIGSFFESNEAEPYPDDDPFAA